jgi:arabinofuranosyltransferase
VFSLIYYGAIFPNTAYAKLGTGIDTTLLMAQGFQYALYFIQADSLLALVIGYAIFDSLASRDALTKMLGLGIILYIVYIIIIGGDFMLGRFFSVPGFLALCLLARSPALQSLNEKNNAWIFFAAIIYCWLSLMDRTVHHDYWATNRHGIADERVAYYDQNGLLPILEELLSTGHEPHHVDRDEGKVWKAQSQASLKNIVILTNNPGMQGYYAGPAVHLVDVLALTDAFLARLPTPSNPPPRVGHYGRLVPYGYCETILNTNPTTDIESLRPLLNDVTLVTRAPLFQPKRWDAIWRLFFEKKYYNFENFKDGIIEDGFYEYYDALPVIIGSNDGARRVKFTQ